MNSRAKEREVEYRGRHLCGQWYYGNLIERIADSPVPETPCAYRSVMIGDKEDGSAEEVEAETVGQFTGLLDIGGNRIYEDDILLTEGGWGGVVAWNSSGYFYIVEKWRYVSDEWEEPSCRPLGEMLHMTKLRVLGNVFDNPEIVREWKYK